MSIYENDKVRRAKRALGVNLAPSPDELLAAANMGKGNGAIANYTTENKMVGVTPTQPSPLPTTIEMPKGLDKITPVTTPAQPVTTSPYQDFAKMWQKPITPEEEARRERAARAVQGVAGLGNLMSAFANLTFTGKGAPSQTLPTQSVDAMTDKMTTWKDKLKAEREKYQAAELGAKVEQWKADLDAQHRAQAQANADRAHEENVRQFNERMAKEEQARKDNMALAEAKAKADAELNQQRMALEQQRVSIARQEANTRLSEAQRKDKPYPMIVDGQLYEIPISRVNEQMIGSIFAKLPEEVRNSAGQPIYGEEYGKKTIVGYKNPSLSDMLAAIGTYGNKETAELIKGLAGVQVEEGSNDDTVEDNNGFKDGGGRGFNAKPSAVGKEKSSFSTKEKSSFSTKS